MTLTLYRNLSESNFVDKNLEEVTSLPGTLKESTSVIDPTFIIEGGTAVLHCNYIYADDFRRFYFVNNITSIRQNLWALSCHVDVLMTYKIQIRMQTALIARQENLYNLYLSDDKLQVNTQRVYSVKAFPNRVIPGTAGNSFILTIAGASDLNNTVESEVI